MTSRIPLTLDLVVAFAVSFGGILVTLLSRNVRVKRIVLPITLVVFHVMAFIVIRRSGALAELPTVALVALLALNAFFAFRVVGYCATCGRTVQGSLVKGPAILCSECALANGR
jgi:hypothetical protein